MIKVYRNAGSSRSIGLCLLVLVSLFSHAIQADSTPLAEHVVIIGVDGMSPAGIEAAKTPFMDGICDRGACTFQARAVLPTKSSPNWASMLTGASPQEHGVTSNRWRRDTREIEPVLTGMEDIFPTLFGQLREQRPGAVSGLFHEWKGLARMVETTAIDEVLTGLDAAGTTYHAAAFLRERKPAFLFVHLDIVDRVGHDTGHGTPEYVTSVEWADELIGQLLRAAREAGIDSSTAWIISADHGGLGTGHGGDSDAEVLIPFFMSGKGVQKGRQITDPVNIYDTAPTAALLLGIELPQAAQGQPVCSGFEPRVCAE